MRHGCARATGDLRDATFNLPDGVIIVIIVSGMVGHRSRGRAHWSYWNVRISTDISTGGRPG